jgi:hypothetical protein
MAKFKKKISFNKIQFKTTETYIMSDILESDQVKDREFRVFGKFVQYKLLESTKNYIIGIIETDRNHSIPPKKNRKTKVKSKIGLTSDESLVYGNIFLYEKKNGIIMYEINKNGCTLDHFLDYIYRCCKNSTTEFKSFDMKPLPVLNGGEYEKFLGMRFHKSFEVEVAEPTKLIKAIKHKSSALLSILSPAAKLKSQKTTLKCDIRLDKKKGAKNEGLDQGDLKKLVDEILEVKASENGSYIEHLEIIGYEEDDTKLRTIDLLADVFSGEIELEEPLQHDDLLEDQRKGAIRDLYIKMEPRLTKLFG